MNVLNFSKKTHGIFAGKWKFYTFVFDNQEKQMNMREKDRWRMAIVSALILGLSILVPMKGMAQTKLLTLDDCRAMALENNKQLGVAKAEQEMAANMRKSARTKFLPRVDAMGGYVWTSREVSLLSDDQKTRLTHHEGPLPITGAVLDFIGNEIVTALRTDTRNLSGGALTVTQPLFMGGAIVAANKMADIEVNMAASKMEARRQNTLLNIDQAYWQVVSLRQKQKLAESFVELMRKLKSDVDRMIEEGVATKGDGLAISVKVNEAEMAQRQVDDGLTLAKMLLCEICGMPVREQITLADEDCEEIAVNPDGAAADVDFALQNRPELKVLESTVDLSIQNTNMLKAGYLPQVLLTGGYAATNPNLFNGFERKFGGFWNVGVMVRVPIWSWGDTKYKVRASKGATTIANLELEEAREMVELQVNQNAFRVEEAHKRVEMANADIANANENLRMATIGFREGYVSATTVMEAHTAWLKAQSQKIDAAIDVKISQAELQKALGNLK